MEIISTITSKGQVTIPKDIRDFLNLQKGDDLIFKAGKHKMEVKITKKSKKTAMDMAGYLDKYRTKKTPSASLEDIEKSIEEFYSRKFKKK